MKIFLSFVSCCVSIVFFLHLAWGSPCQQWGRGQVVGSLDFSKIPEASGIAASIKFANRLYHINDSYNDDSFFITDLQGANTQSIRIDSTMPFNKRYAEEDTYSDFEDISLGPCFTEDSCLFIADIGDNFGFLGSAIRKTIKILIIQEQKKFSSSVRPLHKVVLSYPDGPHNAEALAVHPNGDIFILTKEVTFWGWEASPANLYKISRSQWENSHGQVQQLIKVGKLDLPHFAPPHSTVFGKIVTAFDISPDGTKFLVLTYDLAFEFFHDLSKLDSWIYQDLREGKDFQVIKVITLPQQEGITYLPEANGFMYHTEYSRRWFRIIRGQGFKKAPPQLIRVDCVKSLEEN